MAYCESAWLDDGLALFFGGTPTAAEAAEWDFRLPAPDVATNMATRAPALRLVHQRAAEPLDAETWHPVQNDAPRRAACG